MKTSGGNATDPVAGHYDRLDHYYRRFWGEHLHHGLWANTAFTPAEAVRHLAHRVAEDAQIQPGHSICDVGCGYGAPARLWASAYGAEVVGFTVSEAQCDYAEQQRVDGPRPEYRVQDFLKNQLPDGSVDAVVAIESLTHIRDQPAVFREAARLLRPGGRLVACIWMAAPDPPRWARSVLLDPICKEGRLSGLPTMTDLFQWTTDAGLSVDYLDDVTELVRRTWSVVLGRLGRALLHDADLWNALFDRSVPDRVFARTLFRICIAQRVGALRYGWLVATTE